MTLTELLAERAEKNAGRVFIKFERRKLSFGEVNGLARLVAGGLKVLGLEQQGRAAILMDNCPEYIITYFAVLRAGGIAVPLNTFLTPEEIAYILKDSGCSILVYSDTFSSSLETIRDAVPGLRAVRFSEIPREENETASSSGQDVAVLLYTSGTTGFPKGAMLTHDNLLSNAGASVKALEVTHTDKVLVFLPLFHAFTFTACVLVPLYSGARIVLLKSVKPFSAVIKSIFRERITLLLGVPTIYTILVKKRMPSFMKYLMKFLLRLRACISGAAALPENTLMMFENRFSIPLIEGYGLTEASPVVAVNPLRGMRKPSSVGLPVPGVEVSVIGEKGSPLPAGEVGEVIVKGPNVMKGYFNRREETEAALKGGWLHTGDMGKIDAEGYLYIVDRKKDLIIIDGMNVYPREVEDFVLRHGAVEECAMVGIPDGRGSELSVLFVKPREQAAPDEQEIREHFKGHIARYKIPRRIVFIDDFPRTATGKIKKTELRKRELETAKSRGQGTDSTVK